MYDRIGGEAMGTDDFDNGGVAAELIDTVPRESGENDLNR